MEQLEGMIGTLRVYTSRLATKESYWIFHKDGDDFDLKVSDPKNPSYLLIANDPEMESIIGALNALILNRLVTRVNAGQGKNIPVSIIVDELPTLYFHKIDRLIGTARSNKVKRGSGVSGTTTIGSGLRESRYAEDYYDCGQCDKRLCPCQGNAGVAE